MLRPSHRWFDHPRLCVTFRNKLAFYGDELALRPALKPKVMQHKGLTSIWRIYS
jgi:hypothetical protein